ncbi:MAG: hypothetical protein K0S65_3969 [Labilithrix sp.]|nr:hypothetical protein [Labilithrix sp.]
MLLIASACATSAADRVGKRPAEFDPDAGALPDAACLHQCSLDFRSIVRSCDGTVVETCPADLACAEGACVDPCRATATAKSSLGCEFYLQPPPTGSAYGQSCYAAYVTNAWTTPITFALEHEGKSLDLTDSVFRFTGGAGLERHDGPVPPGDTVVVFVSSTNELGTEEGYTPCPSEVRGASNRWSFPDRSGIASSFHLTTSAPVSAATIYPFGGSSSHISSATLLLPVATWGKQHVIIEPWQRITAGQAGGDGIPGAQIVAAEDGTEITIVPAADIQDGPGVIGTAKGNPAKYTLSKGQFLQLSQDEELTGSFVDSNKPVSVFGGHACMCIPADVGACDSAQQQLPAFEQWGSEYVAVRYRGRTAETESSPYRIVAAFDGTELTYDPAPPAGAPTRMNAKEVATFSTGMPFVVRSQDVEHPIYLAAYMTGGSNPGMTGTGDPEFVNVVPAGQYLSSYTFYADPTYVETSLVVVRQKTPTGFEDVELDCAGPRLEGWTPIGEAGAFEYRRVDLARGGGPGESFGSSTCTLGLHRMTSKGPFTATLWGWSSYTSYGYPGGMAQRTLVEKPLIIR